MVHIRIMTLQEWMDAKGLNDAALAGRLGVVSRSQVSRIRRGISRPSPELAAQLEAATKIPAWNFLKPNQSDRAAA